MVAPGERVATSGGDQIFPKGLTVGTVMKVSPGADLFLNIRLKPSASLNRLEEVLVITKKEDRGPAVADSSSRVRAVDILTQRLPSVPDKPAAETPGVLGPDANTAAIEVRGGESEAKKWSDRRHSAKRQCGGNPRDKARRHADACSCHKEELRSNQTVAR